MDDKQRIALVDTVTVNDKAPPSTLPVTTIRYQFGNHLGTVCLELDETGAVITYEEYYPYGGTAYQAGKTTTEASLKRYRYTAKERDKETGLYYYGARYYAPWISRWISCDPMFMQAATKNLYMAIDDNPVKLIDRLGQDTSPAPDIGQSIPIRVEDRSAHLLSRADWGNFSDIAPGTGRVMGALLKQYNPKALLPPSPGPANSCFQERTQSLNLRGPRSATRPGKISITSYPCRVQGRRNRTCNCSGTCRSLF